MRRFVFSVSAFALLVLGTTAHAQEEAEAEAPADAAANAEAGAEAAAETPTPPQCAGGRVVTEQTAGRCCWPGQSWNETAARCEGPPRCPQGTVSQGDDCLQPASAGPPPGASQQQTPQGYGYPQQPTYMQANTGFAPAPMHEEQQPITGLIVGGAVAFGVGYVFSIVIGSLYISSGACSSQNSWSMFIPLVGGYVWAGIDDAGGCSYSGSTGDIWGIPSASVQVIGLGMLLVGALVTRTVRVPGPAPQASLVPRLADGPGEAGLSLVWDF